MILPHDVTILPHSYMLSSPPYKAPHLTTKERIVSILALRPTTIIEANSFANFDKFWRLFPLFDGDVPNTIWEALEYTFSLVV